MLRPNSIKRARVTGQGRWYYTPVRDESGQVAGVLIRLEDTTERTLADRALRESEARLAAMFEALPVGVGDAPSLARGCCAVAR